MDAHFIHFFFFMWLGVGLPAGKVPKKEYYLEEVSENSMALGSSVSGKLKGRDKTSALNRNLQLKLGIHTLKNLM